MSNQEFENYVALIGKLLQLKPEQRDQIGGELQDHLQMRVADLVEDGMNKQSAISQALEEFGDAAVMAKNFQTVINMKRRRWMMRFATLATAGLFVVATLLMAMWPNNARFGAPEFSTAQETTGDAKDKIEDSVVHLSDATTRNLKAEKALEQATSFDFDESPWSDIEEYLEETMGINIFLDQSAMDDSLPQDEPLSIVLKDVTLAKALNLLLGTKNATYTIDEGIVVIISRDDAEDTERMRLKTFDCRDIVSMLPKSIGTIAEVRAGKKGGGLFCIPEQELPAKDEAKPDSETQSEQQAPLPPQTRGATLLNILYTSISPDSWDHAQGLATANEVNGILIVRQTEVEFRKIDQLLADLRAYGLGGKKRVKVGSRAFGPTATKAETAKTKTRPDEDSNPFARSKNEDDNPFGQRGSEDDDNPFAKTK